MISSFSMLGFRTLSRLLGILTQYDTSLYKIREYVSAPFQGEWGVLPVVPFENKIPTKRSRTLSSRLGVLTQKMDNLIDFYKWVSAPSRGY